MQTPLIELRSDRTQIDLNSGIASRAGLLGVDGNEALPLIFDTDADTQLGKLLCSSIQRRISSTRHTVTRSESLTGFGKVRA